MDWDEIGTAANYVAAEEALAGKGWSRCGVGDWAIALSSPDDAFAARVSPFDPTGPMTAELYRRAASTGRVPRLFHHTRLEGGGDLLVMEYLLPAPAEQAAAFLAAITGEDAALRDLVAIVRGVHAEGAASLPWCGPLDTNPANIMRRRDGTLVLTDPFYADGPNLYATVLEDPERVSRLIPPQERRYLTEIPLAGSGPWPDGEQDRMRAALAAADGLLYGT